MSVEQEKKRVRTTMRQQRDALAPEQRREWSAMLCQRVVQLPAFQRARFLHVFCSFGSEPDTSALLHAAFAMGKRVVVPVTPSAQATELLHVEIEPRQQYTTGVFGIPVPYFPSAEPYPYCKPHEFFTASDCILVPLLAFDANNYRLGYGRGFYDRFLAQTRGARVGIAFAMQRIASVPTEPHDLPLDVIVTEKLP